MKANTLTHRHPQLQVANLPQRANEEARVAQYMATGQQHPEADAPWAWLKFWKWFTTRK